VSGPVFSGPLLPSHQKIFRFHAPLNRFPTGVSSQFLFWREKLTTHREDCPADKASHPCRTKSASATSGKASQRQELILGKDKAQKSNKR
tara:strand:- start:79 stop:348 length:270 start_codon:yes stop_codon:yes gene_type:complete